MEHWLVLGFVDFFVWLNRRGRRPLGKEIPELDELVTAPAEALTRRVVEVGPAKPWGTILLTTLGLTVFVFCTGVMWSLDHVPAGPQPPPKEELFGRLIVVVTVLVGVPAAFLLLTSRLFRGGTMRLLPEGVEVVDRGAVVFLPWALLRAPGDVRRWKSNWVILPVSAEAVPEVVLTRGGVWQTPGQSLRCRPARFVGDGELALRDSYRVNLVECCRLLQHLGRALADA